MNRGALRRVCKVPWVSIKIGWLIVLLIYGLITLKIDPKKHLALNNKIFTKCIFSFVLFWFVPHLPPTNITKISTSSKLSEFQQSPWAFPILFLFIVLLSTTSLNPPPQTYHVHSNFLPVMYFVRGSPPPFFLVSCFSRFVSFLQNQLF